MFDIIAIYFQYINHLVCIRRCYFDSFMLPRMAHVVEMVNLMSWAFDILWKYDDISRGTHRSSRSYTLTNTLVLCRVSRITRHDKNCNQIRMSRIYRFETGHIDLWPLFCRHQNRDMSKRYCQFWWLMEFSNWYIDWNAWFFNNCDANAKSLVLVTLRLNISQCQLLSSAFW